MGRSKLSLHLTGFHYSHIVWLSNLTRFIYTRLDWFQNVRTLVVTVGFLSEDLWQVMVQLQGGFEGLSSFSHT